MYGIQVVGWFVAEDRVETALTGSRVCIGSCDIFVSLEFLWCIDYGCTKLIGFNTDTFNSYSSVN